MRDELASSLDMHEDPSLMLQQLSGSIDKDIGENKTVVNKVSSFGEATCLWNEEDDISKQGDFDNKFSNMSGISGKLNSSQTAIYLENEEQERNDNANQQGIKSTGDIISDVEAHVHDVHVVDGNGNNEPLHQEGDLELDASEVQCHLHLQIETQDKASTCGQSLMKLVKFSKATLLPPLGLKL
ncbi:hypothetical protein RHMOL_Rhmol02G0063900 [Rhododendron molle]|uniref:Uncharacterized protein n=1 Tax=Rhododendron molle TaxID=49168 RepID=A0ACC0PLX0_RHOML|nr:hypothetical protein RHMOL_Rhmol02G0063900 [Rhododendron molle]